MSFLPFLHWMNMAATRLPRPLCACLLSYTPPALSSTTSSSLPFALSAQTTRRHASSVAIDNGRRPITVPAGVTFDVDLNPPKPKTTFISPVRRDRKLLHVKGPKGVITIEIPFFLHSDPPLPDLAKKAPSVLKLSITDERIKTMRQMYNTVNTQIINACKGVTEGHERFIDLVGVGYRCALEKPPYTAAAELPAWMGGKAAKEERPRLAFRLGFSHPHYFDIPEGWDVKVTSPTHIVVRTHDKVALGAFAGFPVLTRQADSRTGDFCAMIRQVRPPEPCVAAIAAAVD